MAAFRKMVFWTHLVCGVVAGLIIGVMSFTGAALAFEKEIVAWAERDARIVTAPAADAKPLPLDELLRQVREARPDARFAAVALTNDATQAIALSAGGRGGGGTQQGGTPTLYANPYTAEVREGQAPKTRAFMRTMNSWHRWLGVEGEHRNAARAVTGACNFAFLGLAITGLYLWWPRNWSRSAVRAVSWFNLSLRGKARDFNWHNVIGLWSAPILIVVTATALPMSYRWANDALYRLTGTEPPVQGGPGSGAGASGAATRIEMPKPADGAKPLTNEALIAAVKTAHPRWEQITLRVGGGGERSPGGRPGGEGGGRRESGGAERGERPRSERAMGESRPGPRAPQPVTITLKEAGMWPRTATTTLTIDPFTGSELKKEGFSDLTAGRRLRTWTRFLHTGEAVGKIGQFLAGLASLGGVVLMYTGFALAWRRLANARRKA